MIIKYYTDNDLAYANRKRRRSIESYTTDLTENQKAVKLGDGATTSIITSEANLCNYVTIGDTRWYVVSYTYLNGGQIQLNLRRDVIGEFGLEGCVGKIERGYTESFLRNRKELDLNQILKERILLRPSYTNYGNYNVSTHEKELWGFLYFAKPNAIDPLTDAPYTDTANVHIPAFEPIPMSYTVIASPTEFITNIEYPSGSPYLSFRCIFMYNIPNQGVHREYFYNVKYPIIFNSLYNRWEVGSPEITQLSREPHAPYVVFNTQYLGPTYFFETLGGHMNTNVKANNYPSVVPKISSSIPTDDYQDAILKISDGIDPDTQEELYHYIQYNVETINFQPTPTNAQTTQIVQDAITSWGTSDIISYQLTSGAIQITYRDTTWTKDTYTYQTVTGSLNGDFVLDMNSDLVDEPFTILAFPLYDTTITRTTSPTLNTTIEKARAFNVFNSVIQATSGENAYLVDAQIYPYCPELTGVATNMGGYPFFYIKNSSFITDVNIQLKPYLDVKKEYIKREYCLVSPEQSGNLKFNYYDYSDSFTESGGDGLNYDVLTIYIKTALKPMNIISSAVIIPKAGCLKGITYNADLRGCQCSGNGFEVSLSTNKFQEYVRNNSNYQAIFGLQAQQMHVEHQVERVNEITSAVVNTVTATAMGAIGGAAVGSAGIASAFGTKAAGAIAGGTISGATVGTAMGLQVEENDFLRDYEEHLLHQNFNLQIGTIKNIPNQVSRISTFNQILLTQFAYAIEIYECSEMESLIVDNFIEKYGYGLGVIEYYDNFKRNNWFLRGTLITSNFTPILHGLAEKELNGGIYYIYE